MPKNFPLASRFAAAGVGAAAVLGAGLLLSADPPGALDVALASTESPLPRDAWWLDDGGLFGRAADAPTPHAVMAAANSCGLICDGADGTAENPDGQGGGLLWGNGGKGFNGGKGGDGGLFGGNGGIGADGVTAGQSGGAGGRVGALALFGDGGDGGNGGNRRQRRGRGSGCRRR